jgi:lysophospholipid acyltransferase (LPLAT)-like uncharacterized protein
LALAGALGSWVLRGLCSSQQFDVVGTEHQRESRGAGEAVVFVTWHGRLLPLLYLYRSRGIVMLVSQHRDGEYLARIGRRLGYDAVRGSSTRGGYPALRALVRKIRDGRSLAITPDGPQGPREQFKAGALQVARITGAPVIPVMAGARRAWWIEGWDRFLVPKPFARIRVAVGKPQRIPRDSSVGDLEGYAERLQRILQELKARVDE